MLNFIKNIGPTELIIIAIILVILFGSKVVAKLGRTSGETFREIKNIKKEFTEAIQDDKEPSNKV
jgi:TatA/E family protein of Tat protein translocase